MTAPRPVRPTKWPLSFPIAAKLDEVLPGGSDGKDLDPGSTLFEKVGGFVNILPPEIGGVAAAVPPLHDEKHYRLLRPAGDHDPVIASLLQLRTERPAAGRLPQIPVSGDLAQTAKREVPGKPLPTIGPVITIAGSPGREDRRRGESRPERVSPPARFPR